MHTFLALRFFLNKFPDTCSMGQWTPMDHTIVPFSHAIPIFVSFPCPVYSNLEPHLPTRHPSACFVRSRPASLGTGSRSALSPGSAMNWAPASTTKPLYSAPPTARTSWTGSRKPLSLEAPYFPLPITLIPVPPLGISFSRLSTCVATLHSAFSLRFCPCSPRSCGR